MYAVDYTVSLELHTKSHNILLHGASPYKFLSNPHRQSWKQKFINVYMQAILGLCCQKQVSQAGISNYIPQ